MLPVTPPLQIWLVSLLLAHLEKSQTLAFFCDGSVSDKGGEYPDDFDEEKVELPSDKEIECQTLVAKGTNHPATVVTANETSEITVPPHKTEGRDTLTVKVTESLGDKEPLVIATKPVVQETVETKPVE